MLKNRFLLLLISLFAVVGFGCTGKAPQTFNIAGKIDNYVGQPVLLFQEDDINRKRNRLVDTIQVDDRGNFDVGYDLEPHIYTVSVGAKNKITLAVGTGQKIVISGDADVPGSLRAAGSPDTDLLVAYEAFRKESLNRLVVSVRDEIKILKDTNTPDTDPELVRLNGLEIDNYIKHKDELMDFVEKSMGASIAVYATSIRWDGDKHLPFLEKLATDFDKDHAGLAIAAKLKEKIGILRSTSIGGQASDIKMPDKDGREIPLSAIEAKYILIDFWASWCAPCRAESRELVSLREKYQKHGFEIYGVGLETEKENWLRAIDADKRSWPNVSTFQEFETPAAFDYAITSLPANFIIDGDRKIIAKNLHGKELIATVERLFGEL